MTTWAVTGATGFVGRHVVERLRREGVAVRALVRGSGGGVDSAEGPALDASSPDSALASGDSALDSADRALDLPLDPAMDSSLDPALYSADRSLDSSLDPAVEPSLGPAVERAVVSLLDREAVSDALDGCDVLVHLAAPRRPGGIGHRPGSADLLIRGAETVLRAALDAGVRRCVFASSASVYGRSWTGVDESSAIRPTTPYTRDRAEGDLRVARIAGERGAELVIVRMSEIFGPGSLTHVPLVRAVARGDMRVIGSGEHAHQMLEVRDAARAMIAGGRVALPRPVEHLVVSGPGNSFRQWIESLAQAVGAPVAFTPALERPARWVLRTLALVPGADRLPRYGHLDYHVRPRSYDVGRSLAVLGDYHRSPFDASVREMVERLPLPGGPST